MQHKKACPNSIVVSHRGNRVVPCSVHTFSLKISWKSNRLFSRNVVDKETSIAKIVASCGLSESTQNVIVSSMVTPRLLWKFHANWPRCFLIMGRYDRIAASRGLLELIENVIRSFYGYWIPSLKISCKSVQPFSHNLGEKEKEISIAKIAASCGLSEST